MRYSAAIGILVLGIAGACAPLHAREEAGVVAKVEAPRSFAIVPAGGEPLRGQYARIAKLVAANLEHKGYRAAGKNEAPALVVTLRLDGRVLRYRGGDSQFSRVPSATAGSGDGPYPYPAGPIPGTISRSSWRGSPAELDFSVSLAIAGGDGAARFAQEARRRIKGEELDTASREMVDSVLARFAVAGE